jgi:hypothetical protein
MGQQARSLFNLSFPSAPGAVTAYRGVDYTGAMATAQGQKIAGIANRGALILGAFEATAIGTAVCEAGAAVAVGDALIVDNTGRAITAAALAVANPTIAAGAVGVTSTAANGAIGVQGAITGGILPTYVFGDALEAAGGAGEFIEVKMR